MRFWLDRGIPVKSSVFHQTVPHPGTIEFCALPDSKDLVRFHDNEIHFGASASSSTLLLETSLCRNRNWPQPIWWRTLQWSRAPRMESVVNWSSKKKANTLPGVQKWSSSELLAQQNEKTKQRDSTGTDKSWIITQHQSIATAKKTARNLEEEL